MWILIRDDAGVIYTGKKDRPFAKAGEKVNVRRDVADELKSLGVAEDINDDKEE